MTQTAAVTQAAAEEWLTSDEAMAILKIGRTKFYELRKAQRLHATRSVGSRSLRVRRSEVMALLEQDAPAT